MAQRHDGTTDEADYSQLFVYAGPEQPDPSNMTTYEHGSTEILGVPVQANIIGSSHYISAPGLRHRELTSCRPIDMVRDFDPVMHHYDIRRGIDDVLIRHTGTHRAEITVQTRHIDQFPGTELADVAYTFGDPSEPDAAPTTVHFTPVGWETWHVYPEFDSVLYTETVFFDV